MPNSGNDLTIDQIVSIRTPDSPVWSPDGTMLAHRLSGFGHAEIWISDASNEPKQITCSGSPTGAPLWVNNVRLVFLCGNTVRSVGINGGEWTVIELPDDATRPVILPSADAAAYIRNGDVFLQEFSTDQSLRLTEGQWLMTRDAHKLIELLHPSPDGRYLALQAPQSSGLNLGVFDRQTGNLNWILPTTDIESVPIWSPDSRLMAFTRFAWTIKWRELWVTDPDGENPKLIHRDESDRWVSRYEFDAAISPSGDEIACIAPTENFGQVMIAPISGGEPRTVSLSSAECAQVTFSPNGEWLAYVSAPSGDERDVTHSRALHVVRLDGSERQEVVGQRRVVENYAWSPDSHEIAAVVSTPRQPNRIFVCNLEPNTQTLRANHAPVELRQPSDVQVGVRYVRSEDDRWDIPVLVMKRRDLLEDGNAPAIVHVHGGGQGQFVLSGWGGYSHRGTIYAMHSRLAQQGYVILDVDYRGSWNYGRDYEVDSYLDVGGGDMRDVIAVAKWAGELPEVDGKRIGLWGRSYGGYMTTLCMVREPELFAAGVNLVGVFNWIDYYNYLSDRASGAWSRSRFERPEDHPDLFEERNPLNDIDKLTKPYLALYGLEDFNVPIDHCWQMVRAMTAAGVDFEMVLYPDEPHVFTKPETWHDALRRIDRFFGDHLMR